MNAIGERIVVVEDTVSKEFIIKCRTREGEYLIKTTAITLFRMLLS